MGSLAVPLAYHQPKLPGRGVIDWRQFLGQLAACGYDGPVCIEVEDREYEGTLEARMAALRESRDHLRPLMRQS